MDEQENEIEETKEGKSKGSGLFSTRNISVAIFFVLVLSTFAGTEGLIIVILLMLIVIAAYYSMYIYFAPREIIMGGIGEAMTKAIMTGTKEEPSFVRAEISYQDYDLDKNWGVVPEAEGRERSAFMKFIKVLFPGLILIGVPGKHWIHKRKFSWTTSEQEGKLKTRTKMLNYLLLKKDVYVGILEDVEVGSTFVPVDITIFITAFPVNAYKPLFEVVDWLEYVMNTTKAILRNFIGQVGQELTVEEEEILDGIEDYQERERLEVGFRLRKAHLAFINQNIGEAIHEEMKKSNDLKIFEEDFGIRVSEVEIPRIDFGEFQKLVLKQYEAQQTGDARIIEETKEGEAYKIRRGLEAQADVRYTEETFAAVLGFKNEGVLLETLKALKDTDKVITVGGIQGVMEQLVGLKPTSADTINPAAIAGLIEGVTGKSLSDINKDDLDDLGKILDNLKKEEEDK